MVKRCHVCRAFTEQRCARCEERCCDSHIYCSSVGGGKELCLACKKQLDPEKQPPPDMFEKGAVAGTAVASGIAVGSLISWELGVLMCFFILCFLGLDPIAEPESKSTRRLRLARAGAGAAAETSPILKFAMGAGAGMAIIPVAWIFHSLFLCTSELVPSPGTRSFDECFLPRLLGPLFGLK
jgi:hypothetical protein